MQRFASLAAALNRYPPERVWECLDGIHLHPLRGSETSMRGYTGPTSEPGVTIKRTPLGTTRLRIGIVPEGGGVGFYDELEGTESSTEGLGRAILARLAESGVLPANEAVAPVAPPVPAPVRPLRKDASSQLRCAACGTELEGVYDSWMTGPNTAMTDGELRCPNPGCPDKGSGVTPTITRGREDDEAPPESGVFEIVELGDE